MAKFVGEKLPENICFEIIIQPTHETPSVIRDVT